MTVNICGLEWYRCQWI